MKQKVMALAVAMGMVGLAGCAELSQFTGTQQAAPQTNAATAATVQNQGSQAQESSFLGHMIKAAKETIGSEAKSTVQSTIRSAGSSIRS